MRLVHFGALLLAIPGLAQNPPAWVARSNQNTQLLIDIEAKFAPEDAAAEGVKGLDEQIVTFAAGIRERERAELRKARQELESRLAKEQEPLVKQDLEILIRSAERDIRSSEAYEKTFLPYADVPGTVFYGVKSLLDDQIAAERRPAVLVRMKKYTGHDAGLHADRGTGGAAFPRKAEEPGPARSLEGRGGERISTTPAPT